MKRIFGPVLLAILIVGVAGGIFISVRDQLASRQVITVRGLIGSEKEEFFKDPRVVEALRKGGVEVKIEKAGSRQIATSFNLEEYDFVFPAGVPAAEKIRREKGVSRSFDVFFTPMTLASWRPIALILEANGVAEDKGAYFTLNMERFLQLMVDGRRWIDLAENSAYPVNKSILISSTDVRKSNSAAMYLALSSYIANNSNVVQSGADVNRVLPVVESLFLKQGYVEYSSEAPFEDYVAMGMGKSPLVMIYEAQFLYRAANNGTTPEMVLIYPQPTIFSKHVLIPLTPGGEKLGELLTTDPDLQRLAIDYGFRNNDAAYFQQFVSENNLSVPPDLVNVIEPPSYEIIERMIQAIEQKYE
jgi:hypothetical protein